MKRRSQQQTPEADLFSYAASNSPTAQEEPQAGPATPPSVKPAPEARNATPPAPEPALAPKPEAAQAEPEPQLPPGTIPSSKPQPKIAPVIEPKPAAAPKATAEAPAPAPEPSPAVELPAFPVAEPTEPPSARARFSRSLVVSIHDVSPMTQEVTEKIMADLAEIGVHRLALLVVPNHHCKGHFLDHPDFCLWLQAQARAGHEIVVHGYHHRRDQRAGETFRQKVATQYYTAGEGEFYDIAGADALRIVSQARQEFRKLGLSPRGFVAPAWLLSEGADRALQRLGVCYTTRISGLFDYTTGTQHHSQSLVWSSRSAWRRGMSLLWNAYLFGRLRSTPLLRIGIHPPDFQYPGIWKQIKTLAGRALKDRVATTYAAYLHLK
ncbi:MAG: DUF2334 domain-containing protein [Chthoniobacteraceae bacterium]